MASIAFEDERISKRTGRMCDATGLRCAFTDLIPAIDARCLASEDVRDEALGRALDQTFKAAEEDGAVIFTFAVTGCRTIGATATRHVQDLDATTMPVDDLVTCVQRCRARFVRCIPIAVFEARQGRASSWTRLKRSGDEVHAWNPNRL